MKLFALLPLSGVAAAFAVVAPDVACRPGLWAALVLATVVSVAWLLLAVLGPEPPEEG